MRVKFKNEYYYRIDDSNLNIYINKTKDKTILIKDGILQYANGKFLMYNEKGELQYEV